MLRKIGHLTAEQFELAVMRSRLSEKGKQSAYRVLVKKETQAQVAKDVGVSREKVRQYCHTVYRQFADLFGCPKGWIATSICLPKDMIVKLNELEKNLRIRQAGDSALVSEAEAILVLKRIFNI